MKRNGWMRVVLAAALVLAAGLVVSRSAALWAQTAKGQTPKEYLALATGAQEVPAVDTPAVAVARFTLTPEGKLNYRMIIVGLKGKFTAMHLHRARAGQSGEVVYPLAGPAADSNIASGSVDFKKEDEADLDNQGFYLNIHTDAFPAGETRGQVVPIPSGVEVTIK